MAFDPDRTLILDHSVELRPTVNAAGAVIGFIVSHPEPSGGGRCGGSVFIEPFDQHPTWRVVSEEPITLEPSLLCHCGFHGWVREGKWQPA